MIWCWVAGVVANYHILPIFYCLDTPEPNIWQFWKCLWKFFGNLSEWIPKYWALQQTVLCIVDWFVMYLQGQERFRTITQSYYRSADGVIIGKLNEIEWIWIGQMCYCHFPVYDITKRSSFLSIQRWIEEVRRYTTLNVMLILVGNKCDLESLREVIDWMI